MILSLDIFRYIIQMFLIFCLRLFLEVLNGRPNVSSVFFLLLSSFLISHYIIFQVTVPLAFQT